METVTMTLTEFLLARIAEDEAVAVRAPWIIAGIDGCVPVRASEDCRARRGVVEEASRTTAACCRLRLRWVCQQLASPYADHPDYRPEWRVAR